MFAYKTSLPAAVIAVAAGWPAAANAQDAASNAPPAAEAVTELPEMVVEAPAKRNVKKVQLRKSGPARAASQAAAAATPAPAGALEQQVVEGEKVVRTVRDSTTSIGVVTGKAIAERQIRDLDEAIEQTANVVTTKDPNAGFSIRGLNSEGQTGLQNISSVPLISVIIDGATQNAEAMRRGARGLWDVEQVEVLRGPQSTLQGRNALGGAVNIKTNDPTYKLGAIVEGTVGTNDLMSGGFVLNAPIVAGQSAFRLSGYATEQTRDIDYADPENAEMGWDKYDSLRGKLLIEPDSLPGFSALFTVSRTDDRPGSGIVFGPDFLERKLSASAEYTDFREGRADNYISDLSYEFRPGMTVRSVTAYAETDSLIYTAAGAMLKRNGDNTAGTDFTQDLRLELANEGNGLSGVVGLFYGYFERDNFSNSTVNRRWVGEAFGFPGLPDEFTQYLRGSTRSETESASIYADLRYRWNDWSLIAGGRLLRDEVVTVEDSEQVIQGTLIFGPPVSVRTAGNTKDTFNEFLPKLGLTYDLTDNQTVGATYNRGYRAGFQQLTLEAGTANPIFASIKPEFLDAYEVSYRSSWWGKTVDLNANVFYYDYADHQVAYLDQFFDAEIVNAGSSHSYGSEIEARWRPTPPLQLYAALGWMQTEFDELRVKGADFAGNEYPEAPAYTISAGAMYRSSTGWFAGANVRHLADYFTGLSVDNSRSKLVDAYTVVDARVGWEWEKYTLTLFAKNLFDENYLTAVSRVDGGTLSPSYGMVGDSRLVGVTLTGRF
ncbi:MAG: TonB-dependent receptor [Hyphomicrobiaceae bacterium]|nr:TonB-dependent receptor [Hyphomicrobiaceae bacterium]